ncbi:MAG TPA: hypothetical protein VGN17_08040 [Bryobacteraceae bacterium]|jgi:hypothetical protein
MRGFLTASALLVFAARLLSAAATLTIAPSVIYDCTDTHGQATLTWTGASGPVQIRVLSPQGPAMTGFNPPAGSVSTDNWVSDNQTFYLVNQQGSVEASVTSRVQCGGTPNTLDQGLQGGSFLPLQLGNTWVYRYSTRFITSVYVTLKVTGTQQVNGKTYFVLSSVNFSPPSVYMIVRGDNAGRIWQLTGTASSPQEALLLDPASVAHAPYSGPLGNFPDAIMLSPTSGGLIATSETFVRGLGLAHTYSTMLTGSSGGFTDGMDLVEARLGGGVQLAVPPPARFSLSLENLLFDVTGHNVMDCSVPCYFVACYLAPGADPPGTYKPCAQVRVEGGTNVSAYALDLEVDDASGKAVYHAPSLGGQDLEYVQIPLYAQPNQPFPPGQYQLVGRLSIPGAQIAVAQISFRVQ